MLWGRKFGFLAVPSGRVVLLSPDEVKGWDACAEHTNTKVVVITVIVNCDSNENYYHGTASGIVDKNCSTSRSTEVEGVRLNETCMAE